MVDAGCVSKSQEIFRHFLQFLILCVYVHARVLYGECICMPMETRSQYSKSSPMALHPISLETVSLIVFLPFEFLFILLFKIETILLYIFQHHHFS